VGSALALMLAWMIFRRERPEHDYTVVNVDEIVSTAARFQKKFCRVGVALEAKPSDGAMLAEAVALARVHGAELVLMHVVEGVGGQWYGPQTGDLESRQDEAYLTALVDRLRQDPSVQGLPKIHAFLGYGNVPRQVVQLAKEHQVDLLVAGGHGHRGLADVIHGTTIDSVRHGLDIPILAVRS
jgi:manganese transport protein